MQFPFSIELWDLHYLAWLLALCQWSVKLQVPMKTSTYSYIIFIILWSNVITQPPWFYAAYFPDGVCSFTYAPVHTTMTWDLDISWNNSISNCALLISHSDSSVSAFQTLSILLDLSYEHQTHDSVRSCSGYLLWPRGLCHPEIHALKVCPTNWYYSNKYWVYAEVITAYSTLFFIAVINTTNKSNVGRKRFISSCSLH